MRIRLGLGCQFGKKNAPSDNIRVELQVTATSPIEDDTRAESEARRGLVHCTPRSVISVAVTPQ